MTTTHVAHHFDDATQQFDAARLGMWVFLATEVLFFGGLFVAYAYYRTLYPHEFVAASKHLGLALGTLNTGVLLVSSFTMALAVRAAQLNSARDSARLLAATLTLGCVFLGIKGYEYWEKWTDGLIPGAGFSFAAIHDPAASSPSIELFFLLYFAMTGLHALHMVIGVSLLAAIGISTWKGRYSYRYYTPVEVTGLYWHFVDIVWVFLFPLLYLVR